MAEKKCHLIDMQHCKHWYLYLKGILDMNSMLIDMSTWHGRKSQPWIYVYMDAYKFSPSKLKEN